MISSAPAVLPVSALIFTPFRHSLWMLTPVVALLAFTRIEIEVELANQLALCIDDLEKALRGLMEREETSGVS